MYQYIDSTMARQLKLIIYIVQKTLILRALINHLCINNEIFIQWDKTKFWITCKQYKFLQFWSTSYFLYFMKRKPPGKNFFISPKKNSLYSPGVQFLVILQLFPFKVDIEQWNNYDIMSSLNYQMQLKKALKL